MPLPRSLLSGLLIVLTACSSSGTSQQTATKEPSVTTDPVQAKLSPLFSGTITRKGDEASFTPCGSKVTWKFNANDTFWQQWQQLGSPESFQASVTGNLATAGRGDPFMLQMLNLSAMTAEQTLCQDNSQSFQLKASNAQPFWSLFVDNGQASYTNTDGSVSSYQVKEVSAPTDQSLSLALEDDSGKKMTLSFQAGSCPADKNIYGYTVNLQTADGQTLTGCGQQGVSLSQQQPAHVWKGRLELAQSDLTLTLNPNAVAHMEMKRDTGPSADYDGVWQVKDKIISVMFNQRLGLPTDETYVFEWTDAQTLTANYRELAGGKAYFAKPLVLKADANAVDPSPTVTANSSVVVAPPPATDNAAGGDNFSAQETVVATTPTMNATSAAAATDTSSANMAPFSAGSLQASVSPDAAIAKQVSQYLTNNGGQATGAQYRYAKADLNGDGMLDAIVELNQCDNGSCKWLVLKGDAGQFQSFAQLEGFSGTISVSPTAHNGWYDLLTDGNSSSGYGVIAFDGTAYASKPAALEVAPDESSLLELDFSGDNWATLQ